MKIEPITQTYQSDLNNKSKEESQYNYNKKYKCPRCNHIMSYNDFIKLSNIDEEYMKALVKQKIVESGYEFGIVE